MTDGRPPYPWIMTGPRRSRPLLPVKPSRLPTYACDRCACEWPGPRKKCPACHARVELEREPV